MRSAKQMSTATQSSSIVAIPFLQHRSSVQRPSSTRVKRLHPVQSPANAVVFHAAAGFDASAVAQVQQCVRRRLLRRFVRRGVLPADDAQAIISPDRVYGFDRASQGKTSSEHRKISNGILSITFDYHTIYILIVKYCLKRYLCALQKRIQEKTGAIIGKYEPCCSRLPINRIELRPARLCHGRKRHQGRRRETRASDGPAPLRVSFRSPFAQAPISGGHQRLVGAGILGVLTVGSAQARIYLDPSQPTEARITDLLPRMTPKISQFYTSAPAIPALQIPRGNGWNQALHGVVWNHPTTMCWRRPNTAPRGVNPLGWTFRRLGIDFRYRECQRMTVHGRGCVKTFELAAVDRSRYDVRSTSIEYSIITAGYSRVLGTFLHDIPNRLRCRLLNLL
jgi:hypothetical protein